MLDKIIAELDAPRYDLAIELASLPAQVRGYGPIKRAAAERAATVRRQLLERWAAVSELARKWNALARLRPETSAPLKRVEPCC